jgi:hypothetical protein
MVKIHSNRQNWRREQHRLAINLKRSTHAPLRFRFGYYQKLLCASRLLETQSAVRRAAKELALGRRR